MQTPTPDPPQRLLFTSRTELDAALLQLIVRARRTLRLAAADLSVLAVDGIKPVAALRQFLLAHADNRVRLLVDDTTWLDSRAPRLRQLQRDFSHAVLFRRTDAQDQVGDDVVALGDELDALLLQPVIGVVGELRCHSTPFVQPVLATFDRRWEHASHNLPAAPLGL